LRTCIGILVTKNAGCYEDGIEICGYGAYNKKPGILNKLIRFETFIPPCNTCRLPCRFTYMGVVETVVQRELSFEQRLSSINHVASGDDDLFINQVATNTM